MDFLPNESDWESFSESSSSEEQEEIKFLYGGILSSLEDSIGKIDDFLSFERGFVHGEIVCSMADPSGQTGRVINIDMFVDLENALGKKIKDVNSKNLLKIRSVSVGDYVVHETWIGRVDRVVDRVSIIFDNGSNCEVVAVDQDKVLPVSPNLFEDLQYPYYPGQRVKVLDSNAIKSTSWLCGTWRDMQSEGTVSAVDAGLVYVNWIASTHLGSGLRAKPPSLQEPKNLTLLSCFSHANWQLSDWCILPFAEQGGVCEQNFLNGTTCDCIKNHRKLGSGLKREKSHSGLEQLFVIVKTKTKVDVLWQDGSRSVGLDSHRLIPVSSVTAHEFWPEQFVLEKEATHDSPRWGVVLRVDAKERTVNVQWRSMIINEAREFRGEEIEETVSAYELIEHPDYSFCFGDVVFRVVQNGTSDLAYNGHVLSGNDLDEQAALKINNNTVDEDDNTSQQCLSCIGVVVGFKDGEVKVKWATGSSTKVAPYEIYQIDKYEDSTTTPALSQENGADVNQEMIGHDKESFIIKDKDSMSFDDAGENRESNSSGPVRVSLPQAAVGFFTSIASSLLASLGSISLFGSVPSYHIISDRKAYEDLNQNLESEAHNSCAAPDPRGPLEFSMETVKQECEENENQNIIFPGACKNPHQFKQFDIVQDCSDHHFIAENKAAALSQVKRSWLKKVQQEWSILEDNLPETIYVRTYEERMDILRAAIVGPAGTPYHDGLFFFDIFLPPEYPYEPPLVHYNSGGLRLNPNLYESGRVCLSLLNTWTGSGTEVWTPESSTILQVLLSLQGLVLNEKPYFNEAGYDKQMGSTEGEKNSICYNESAFLLTWRSMLYVLGKPPKHFEALVLEHFNKRSLFILLACEAYMEGTPIGSALECNESWLENAKGSSAGFKIMLAKLFPKLVQAFSDKGIDCARFSRQE